MSDSGKIVAMALLSLAAGCRSPLMQADGHRMSPYRPISDTIVIPDPQGAPATGEGLEAVMTNQTVAMPDGEGIAPVSVNSQADEGGQTAAVPEEGATAAVPEEGQTASVPEEGQTASVPEEGANRGEGVLLQRPGTPAGTAGWQRVLSRGDRIMVSLRGIPRVEDIKNVIDGLGEVTLPYIGQVRVAGLTPSDAERLIESTYVDRGIYRSVNVIVVAEDKVYFVQGEVARQGKFSMSGDVTLLQAITEAGGYTPFANPRKVKVIRGDQVLFFNARNIANGRDPDPMIESDDIIVVLRSLL